MPRNGSGTMSIVNSFSPNTTASSADVNENFTDIASEITGSLPRDGQASMTGVFKSSSGTVSAPGMSFGSDTDSGFYRIGGDNVGLALGGAKALDLGASQTGFPDGAVGAPGVGFFSDTDCGIYRIGANNIGIAVGGTKIIDIASTGITVTGNIASTGGPIPSGTVMLFVQTAAPTGWTKSSAHNDKTLRVVSGSASSGGSVAFSTVFGITATDSHTLTSSDIPSHTHTMFQNESSGTNLSTSSQEVATQGNFASTNNYVMAAAGASSSPIGKTAATGSGGGHTHNIDLRVNYVDCIIASRD